MFRNQFISVIEPDTKLGKGMTLPLQFESNTYPTPKSNTVALFINDREYKVYLAKLPSVNALYCPKWIVFSLGWSVQRLLRFVRITQPTCYGTLRVISEKNQKVPKQFVVSHKLHGYSLAVVSHCYKKIVFKLRKRAVFEMFSTPTLGCMKDLSGFWAEQWVWFYLSEDTTLKDEVIHFEVC
uniref:Uncharacterized protein n=1 Tax=Tanacetum cinerariifolium TaxID=118510 RepID=A0A699IC87_TANCI|nr:hypothetical protein [Tanacetum cinerariifolium]